jgi:hypothetical protein
MGFSSRSFSWQFRIPLMARRLHLTLFWILIKGLIMPEEDRNAAQQPTNYRQTRRNQDRMQVVLVILMLVVGGSSLIGLIWGVQAAMFGGVCLVAGAILIGGLWLGLSLVEKLMDE